MNPRTIRILAYGGVLVVGIALMLAFYDRILGALVSIGVLVGLAALILGIVRRAFRR